MLCKTLGANIHGKYFPCHFHQTTFLKLRNLIQSTPGLVPPLKVAFRRMAQERNHSFFDKSKTRLNIDAHCPALIKAKSVYSTLINSSRINHLTIISLQALQAISHRRRGVSVNRALRGQCETEALWWGEQCLHAWLTLTDMYVHVAETTSNTHWPPLRVHGQLNAHVFLFTFTTFYVPCVL